MAGQFTVGLDRPLPEALAMLASAGAARAATMAASCALHHERCAAEDLRDAQLRRFDADCPHTLLANHPNGTGVPGLDAWSAAFIAACAASDIFCETADALEFVASDAERFYDERGVDFGLRLAFPRFDDRFW